MCIQVIASLNAIFNLFLNKTNKPTHKNIPSQPNSSWWTWEVYLSRERHWLFSSTVYGSKWGGNYGMLHWHCQHFICVSFQTLAVWNILLESAVTKANELSWAIRFNCLSVCCEVTCTSNHCQTPHRMMYVWCLETHYWRSSLCGPFSSQSAR